MLRIVRVWGSVAAAPGPFVAHPADYPWRVRRLRSPLPFHRLNAIIPLRYPGYKRIPCDGRPPVKGRKLPSPGTRAMRKNQDWRGTTVDWYGGGRRRVCLLSDTGRRYNKGRAVPIRWVMVLDVDETHRDDCVFTTDVSLSPEQIVSLYTRRWSIEVTFQEVRAHLGFETTRQWAKPSVLRMAPCLPGLFTVISLAFDIHLRRHKVRPAAAAWYEKQALTFSDAIRHPSAIVARNDFRERHIRSAYHKTLAPDADAVFRHPCPRRLTPAEWQESRIGRGFNLHESRARGETQIIAVGRGLSLSTHDLCARRSTTPLSRRSRGTPRSQATRPSRSRRTMRTRDRARCASPRQ